MKKTFIVSIPSGRISEHKQVNGKNTVFKVGYIPRGITRMMIGT